MSLIKEAFEDLTFLRESLLENVHQEYIFDGNKGPLIALHGVGGGWVKNGFREYMIQNRVKGILNYFGPLEDGLDSYVDRLNDLVDKYEVPMIVGFSAGGLIALKYAEKYGWNKFSKIITIASPLYGTPIAKLLKNKGQTYQELSPGSSYLNKVCSITPPEGKVISLFAKADLKAPFKNLQVINWPVIITDARSHGEIHSNYKLIEPFLNRELRINK